MRQVFSHSVGKRSIQIRDKISQAGGTPNKAEGVELMMSAVLNFPFRGVCNRPTIVEGEHTEKVVPLETLKLLETGDLAIEKVKGKHLPFGSGNNMYDLLRTGYHSFEATVYARTCKLNEAPGDEARDDFGIICRGAAIARAAHGGNCGEHALDTAATLNKLVPAGTTVNLCRYTNVDHEFVVLGNVQARSPENGKLVVVDSYPPESQALLAEDHVFGNPAQLEVLARYEAEGPAAAGARRVTRFIPNVLSAQHTSAASQAAPPLQPGTQANIKVFPISHGTRDNQVITYVSDAPEAATSR